MMTSAVPGNFASGDWRRDFLLRRLLAIVDASAIVLALYFTAQLEESSTQPMVVWGFVALPAWTFLFRVYGLYERDQKRVSHGTFEDLPWLFHAVLVGSLLTWCYYAVLPEQELGAQAVATFGGLALGLVTTARFVFRHLSHVMLPPERVLFLGWSPMSSILASKIGNSPQYGLAAVGALSPRPIADDVLLRLGELEQLERTIREQRIDRVMIASDAVGEMEMLELTRVASELGVKVSILPAMHDVLGPSVEIDSVEGITVLGINPPELSRSSRALKRTIDVVLAGIVGTLALPVMAVVAITVRLDSAGPILFRQPRVGLAGRRFDMLKFRTMVADAEARREDLLDQSKDAGWLHLEHDPRITRVGRILRQLSLDELPQLWNVLRGEMSLVGPRPLIEAEDRNVAGWGRRRLDLTPGVTGMWQVLGRTDIPFDEMIKLDYLYVTNWSLWRDFKIIIDTVPALLSRRGVN